MTHIGDFFLETILDDCSEAYAARSPLIFLDTHDSALVQQLVLLGGTNGKLVPLQLPEFQDSSTLAPYYRHLDIRPDQLTQCKNYYSSTEDKTPELPGAEPALYVFYLDSDTPIKFLRKYVDHCLQTMDPNAPRSCVLIYGELDRMPSDLRLFTTVVTEPYPNVRQIHAILLEMMDAYGLPPFEATETSEAIARTLTGIRFTELLSLIRQLFLPQRGQSRPRLFHPEARAALIRNHKANMLLREGGGVLELVEQEDGLQNTLCNMDRLLDYCRSHAEGMLDQQRYAAERGVPAPKGLLICGLPGSGKSEAAKLLGPYWGLSTVRLHTARIIDSHLGQSEKNLARALSLAEKMAPAVLWIDEIDKLFSQGSRENSATITRMIGLLLEWMATDHGCFVAATANDITVLPAELLRKGRFNGLWATFLPTEKQCRILFHEHMRRAERVRQTAARQQGKPDPGPMFCRDSRSDCFGMDTTDAVIALFGKGKFLTAADIATIVKEALNALDPVCLQPFIMPNDWLAAVQKVASQITTDASSADSLDHIAASYVRLLRGSFESVSSETLFEKKHFDPNREPAYNSEAFSSKSEYDKQLFEALVTRINALHAAQRK